MGRVVEYVKRVMNEITTPPEMILLGFTHIHVRWSSIKFMTKSGTPQFQNGHRILSVGSSSWLMNLRRKMGGI